MRPAECTTPNALLWIHIVLLIVGCLYDYLKAGSKASLIASVSFAVPLIFCALDIILKAYMADVILAVLLVFFAVRLSKSKKFMPNGFMLVLTVLTLALRHIKF